MAGGLTKRPGKRQGAYDRCDDGRAEHAETEDQASRGRAEVRRQRLADLSHAAQRGMYVTSPEGRGRDEEHRSAHHLGKHGPQCGIPPRRSVMPVVQPLFGHGGLLVIDHPRVEHRADQGCREKPETAVANGYVD